MVCTYNHSVSVSMNHHCVCIYEYIIIVYVSQSVRVSINHHRVCTYDCACINTNQPIATVELGIEITHEGGKNRANM